MIVVDRVQYHIPDWMTGTEELSFEEEAAYRKLCDSYYLTDGHLKDDDHLNSRRLKVSVRKFRVLKNALLDAGKITVKDGYIQQARAERELQNILAASERAKEKARKRHEKTPENELKTEEKTAENSGNPLKNNNTTTAVGHANSLTRKLVSSDTSVSDAGASADDLLSIPLRLIALHRADPKAALFRHGLPWLASVTGKPADRLRPLVGKWLKATGDDAGAVYDLLADAQADERADPVGWVTAAVRGPPEIDYDAIEAKLKAEGRL